jgi:hypothetical protein
MSADEPADDSNGTRTMFWGINDIYHQDRQGMARVACVLLYRFMALLLM